jgi:hypothetical protein
MERYETMGFEERGILIQALTLSKYWKLIATTESTQSTYYLFQSRISDSVTIGVNDGKSDFYDDVIFTNN